MKLLVVIPALDEEASIEAVIERTLAARTAIVAGSPVTEVDVTVVSDGSTDTTVERARAFTGQVDLIVFDQNRGYGAAIKEAWSRSDADLLGFLDADGTCDPAFFAVLCERIERDGADIVLGSRMNAESTMPLARRMGNTLFAMMLSAMSSRVVHDTASGMRVVRRTSLPRMLPLPDGLHFTPAMSARAILGEDLKLCEVDMPYRERQGRSKLRLGRDGVRFLRVILQAASLYRPSRLFGLLSLLCLSVAVSLTLGPALFWLRTGSLREWMIYRFIVSDLTGVSACLLFCAGYLTGRIVDITVFFGSQRAHAHSRLRPVVRSPWFWALPAALVAAGVAFVARSFADRITTGATYEHWSHFVAMSFLCSVALVLAVTKVIDRFLDLVAERLTDMRGAATPSPAPRLASEVHVPVQAPR